MLLDTFANRINGNLHCGAIHPSVKVYTLDLSLSHLECIMVVDIKYTCYSESILGSASDVHLWLCISK